MKYMRRTKQYENGQIDARMQDTLISENETFTMYAERSQLFKEGVV